MRPILRLATAAGAAACLFGAAACAAPAPSGETSAAGPATVTVVSTVQHESTMTITAQQVPSRTSSAASTPTTGAAGGEACEIDELNVTLGEGDGAAGSSYYPLTFTNKSFEPCTLQGFPQVAYVAGDDLHQVGGAAAENGDAGAPITLQPGEHTSAALQEVVVENFDADVCDPTPVKGLRVWLAGSDDAAFVPQQDQTGCAVAELPGGQFQMSVQTFGALD